MKMIAKLALPDEVADCLADGDHGRLQVGHGVAVLALLMQDDQLAHLHTRSPGHLVTRRHLTCWATGSRMLAMVFV